MKKSAELARMFLNGKSEKQLSQKQANWLRDVLTKDGYSPGYAGSYIFNDEDFIYGIKSNMLRIQKVIEKEAAI